MTEKDSSCRIRLLRDDVARKIAAGEVIDRPFSIVRELMDNAIDAGASSIKVDIRNGGIGSIRVSDNGSGMSADDLSLCYKAHATSKIESVEDLYHTRSLGFRGEALGSIGACAKLSIISSTGEEGRRLRVENGEMLSLEPHRSPRGTTVEAADIFYNLPGRRRFLKSAKAEGGLCRAVFLEKAAAFPKISFQLLNDGEVRLTLPEAELTERASTAYASVFTPALTKSFGESFRDFSFTLVHASPAVYRRDRRYIHVYVNRRRIQEYSLVQAVEYGFSSVLPGGSFPVALLFLEIDPELVDFNIHPAKREARIRNIREVHHAVSSGIQETLETATRRSPFPGSPSPLKSVHQDLSGFDTRNFQESAAERSETGAFTPSPNRASRSIPSPREDSPLSRVGNIDSWKGIAPSPRLTPENIGPGTETAGIRYLGQAFDLFLICQAGEELYLIDQHAAHERILYNRFSAPGQESQGLIVPIEIEMDERENGEFYEELLSELVELGFRGKLEKRQLTINAIPASYRGVEKELEAFLGDAGGSVRNLLTALYADMACKAAIRDGETLDDVSARELAREALALPDPRCPHGRPVWFRLSRQELFALVGRS
jgi:DNA mismatch repair protein MutL